MRARALMAAGAVAAVVAVAAPPRAARADAAACTAAAEQGQALRNADKLVEARAAFLMCLRACPRIVQADCSQWLSDVEARIPSVVLSATDASGRDLGDVRVAIDGAPPRSASVEAIPINPGPHHFVFEREGSPRVDADATVREGERARTVSVRFPSAPAPPKRAPPIVPIALAGAGVVALAASLVYHFSAASDIDTLRGGCAPRCPQDQVDALDRKIFVSDFALGLSIAALVAAGVVYFTTGTDAPPPRALGAPLVVRF